MSLFVLLYVELASFGTPPTPHTHARRHHKPRHSPHHAHSWEGGDVDVLRRRHIPGAPALDRPLLGASWERRAMRYVVRRTHKPRHSPHHATLGRGGDGVVRRTRHIPAPAPDRPLLGASCLGEAGDEVVRRTQFFE